MVDIFQQNLENYQKRQARGVGGPYGKAPETLLGHHPSPGPVFCDDFTAIKSDDDRELYKLTPAEPIRIFKDVDSGDDFRHEFIYKFERPVTRIEAISVGISGLRLEVSGFERLFPHHPILGFALIKVPLAVGADPENPFALDKLTYTNSHNLNITSDSGTGGTRSTLYATAGNVEEDKQRYFFLNRDYDVSGTQIPTGVLTLDVRDSALTFINNKDVFRATSITHVFLDISTGTKLLPRTNGPYFGIHWYLGGIEDEGPVFESRHPSVPRHIPSQAGEAYDFRLDINLPGFFLPNLPSIFHPYVWEEFPFV